jgi:hypothetical protein
MRLIAFGPALLGVVAALGLAACGEASKPKTAEHVALVKYCKADGGKEKDCECAADKTDDLLAQELITPKMYEALVLQAQGKIEESDAIMESMDIHQKFAQVTAVGDASAACAGPAS